MNQNELQISDCARCPYCDSENLFLYEQVDIRQSVIDYDGKKITVNREHAIVLEYRAFPAEFENDIEDEKNRKKKI